MGPGRYEIFRADADKDIREQKNSNIQCFGQLNIYCRNCSKQNEETISHVDNTMACHLIMHLKKY